MFSRSMEYRTYTPVKDWWNPIWCFQLRKHPKDALVDFLFLVPFLSHTISTGFQGYRPNVEWGTQVYFGHWFWHWLTKSSLVWFCNLSIPMPKFLLLNFLFSFTHFRFSQMFCKDEIISASNSDIFKYGCFSAQNSSSNTIHFQYSFVYPTIMLDSNWVKEGHLKWCFPSSSTVTSFKSCINKLLFIS